MGVYIYTLRAEHVKARLNGEVIKVHALKFFSKPHGDFFWGKPTRYESMGLARAEAYWSRHPLPKYVHLGGDNLEGGEAVYEWTGKSHVWWDTDNIPGNKIGDLVLVRDGSRKGFHWAVEPHVCHPKYQNSQGWRCACGAMIEAVQPV